MARRRGAGRNSLTSRREAKNCQDHALNSSTEQEERRFARPDKISPHLFCVICSEVFKNPYRAPCGHSYCYMVILLISLLFISFSASQSGWRPQKFVQLIESASH